MTLADIAAGLAILVGLAGILVPILPGSLLILVALLAWAAEVGTRAGWLVAGVGAIFLVIGTVVKYLLPGRRLKATVPTSTMVVGAVGAIIGFFVIPVVGALLGFPIGVYVAEHRRLGAGQAWPSTKAALKAVGASILIEFVAGLLAAAVFVAGVVAV
ncbi:MAG: DUF456 domain-containing protein [Nocardioidaceae bacterium]